MEKIFKKSLALVLSAALCLTAFVGCLTVSAADETTPAYAISTDAKGKVGDTVEVIAEYTNISTVCGHYVTVTFPANFTVKEVYQAKESADGETYKLLTAYKEGSEENWQYKMDVVEGKTAIKSCDIINFFASEGSEHNVTTGSLKFKFVVTIGEVEVGEYPVTIAVEAASQDEMWITPVITNGKITVEANTPAHEHVFDETANQVVTFDSTGITYNKVCTTDKELVPVSKDTSDNAVTVATTATKFTAYSAVNDVDGGTFTIDFALPEGKTANDVKVAYVSGNKIIANGYHSSLSDGDLTNGENAIAFSYADGVATLTTEKTGVFVVFVPSADSVLPTANIGMTQTFDLGSSISILFKVNKTNLANFDSVYAVIDHEAYNGNTVYNHETKIDKYEIDGTYYVFSYPVSAMQMGDDVTASYYGVEDGVSYLLRVKTDYSLVAYAAGSVGYKGTDTNLKTLLSDMFTYGSIAQRTFAYHTDALVSENAAIAGYIAQYPASETVARESIEYVPSSSTYADVNNKLCGFNKGLNLESTVEVYYRVNLSNFITKYGESELSNLQFRVSYKEASKTNTDVTPTVVTYGINDNVASSNKRYDFLANKIVAPMMASQTEIGVYYNNPTTGNCEWLATSVYSINTYLYNNYDSTVKIKSDATANLGDICKAVATYGVSARNYFGIVS